jgi:hypothetical protein
VHADDVDLSAAALASLTGRPCWWGWSRIAGRVRLYSLRKQS